jgi:hypothetical protein
MPIDRTPYEIIRFIILTDKACQEVVLIYLLDGKVDKKERWKEWNPYWIRRYLLQKYYTITINH